MILSEVAEQREKVTEAQWNYFVSALKQDQTSLQKVQEVPHRVKSLLHAKTVQQRRQQAEAGHKAVSGYSDPWI